MKQRLCLPLLLSAIRLLPTFSATAHTGEELLISYLPYERLFVPLSSRREALIEGWKFMCHCVRCSCEARMSPAVTFLAEALERDLALDAQHPGRLCQAYRAAARSPHPQLALAQLKAEVSQRLQRYEAAVARELPVQLQQPEEQQRFSSSGSGGSGSGARRLQLLKGPAAGVAAPGERQGEEQSGGSAGRAVKPPAAGSAATATMQQAPEWQELMMKAAVADAYLLLGGCSRNLEEEASLEVSKLVLCAPAMH